MDDLYNYNVVGSLGAGPYWHDTDAHKAHEEFHRDTDWMVTCVSTEGDWADTEADIEQLRVPVSEHLLQAHAEDALTGSVSSRFATFRGAAVGHWTNEILPDDKPGLGGGAYAAAQAVLDDDADAIESYRQSKGW